MPSAERYAEYRADKTTIWISKRAAEVLGREREAGESTATVVDRLMSELRALRRGGASKSATSGVGRKGGAKRAPAAGAPSRGQPAKKAAGGRARGGATRR